VSRARTLTAMSLDPDDPRPPYLQVANALRDAITGQRLVPGEKLPSGGELASRYNVARMTVQNAIRVLRDEGLVVSRQGSGVYVRSRAERPVGLRPHVERAFERPNVSIDFAGFSGETLHGVLQEPLDKIRDRTVAVESITVRALVPDLSAPLPLPCRTEDLADDEQFRGRAAKIMARSLPPIADALDELRDLGLVDKASLTVRVHHLPPTFKLYVLNGEEAFFGFYPVREHTVTIGGEKHNVYDVMGKDAVLFHQAVSDDADALGTQYVRQATMWFDSLWSTIARDQVT
jgi:DNA-binding transcriptional regulator YhcF (GntR family)